MPDHPGRHSPAAPLLLPALALAAGISFDDAAGRGPVPYLVGLVLVGILLFWPFARRECAWLAPSLAAFCCGGLYLETHQRRAAESHVVRFTADGPIPARLRGRILNEPDLNSEPDHPFAAWWPEASRTRFLMEVEAIETRTGWAVATGSIRVHVRAPLLTLVPGDKIEAFGSLYRPPPPENPGQYDWTAHDRRRGIFAALGCHHAECVRVLVSGADVELSLWAGLRERARTLLLGDLLHTGESEGSLLDTMLLGRRAAIDPRVNDAFRRTGLTHYLAVSGLNVGILGALFWVLGRGIGLGNRACAVLATTAVLLYAWMTDPLPPIQRAALMAVAVCAAFLLGRPRNFLNGLSAAAIVILLLSPGALFDVGFQLSFTALIGIVYGTPAVIHGTGRLARLVLRGVGIQTRDPDDVDLFLRPEPRSIARRLAGRAAAAIGAAAAVSFAAWAATLPLILLHFSRFTPWGWLNTLLVAPLVGLLMAAGPAKLLAALAWPSLADALTAPVLGLSAALIALVEWLAEWPYAEIRTPLLPAWLALTAYAATAGWLLRRRLRHGTWLAAVLSTGVLAGTVVWLIPRGGDERLTMTVLSVGRGTSVVLELPDGGAMLYDVGASGAYDPGKTVVVPYLRHRGVRRLESIIISHPDLDHFSGLPTVLEEFPTEAIHVSAHFEAACLETDLGQAALEQIARSGCPLRRLHDGSADFELGGARFQVLWPPRDPDTPLPDNDSSLTLRVCYAGRCILLTGDIESRPQRSLLARGGLSADVMLMPHHGALCESTAAFVGSVGAKWLVSSTFVRTEDRPPAYHRIIEGRRHLSTADDGAVTITIAADGTVAATRRRFAAGAEAAMEE